MKEQYQNEIVDAMIKKFGYKNIMEVPKLDKVVLNMAKKDTLLLSGFGIIAVVRMCLLIIP